MLNCFILETISLKPAFKMLKQMFYCLLGNRYNRDEIHHGAANVAAVELVTEPNPGAA